MKTFDEFNKKSHTITFFKEYPQNGMVPSEKIKNTIQSNNPEEDVKKLSVSRDNLKQELSGNRFFTHSFEITKN